MSAYSLSHLGDRELLRALAALVARERAVTAALLAHIAEVDARRLYLPAAHPSMFSYCVHALGLSEEAAFKRIHAARTARRFPALFPAPAQGRLHLSAVILLAPHLTAENADDLLASAAHKTKAELERLLAERCPRPDLPARVEAIPPPPSPAPLLPGDQHAPGRVEAPLPPPRVAPLSPQRYALQFTLDQEAYDDLRYVQALLGHQVPAGDLAQVFGRALKALAETLERTRFAATPRPRRSQRPSPNPRHLPAAVKRAVWQRDGGQCTFLSAAGQRCPARTRLETVWNDGLAVVRSCHLREERPTRWHEATLDRGLAPAASEPHTKGARRGHAGYHLRRDGRSQEGDQRGDAVARAAGAGGVAGGQ